MAVHLAPAHAKRMAVMLARCSGGFAFRHHTAEQALAALAVWCFVQVPKDCHGASQTNPLKSCMKPKEL